MGNALPDRSTRPPQPVSSSPRRAGHMSTVSWPSAWRSGALRPPPEHRPIQSESRQPFRMGEAPIANRTCPPRPRKGRCSVRGHQGTRPIHASSTAPVHYKEGAVGEGWISRMGVSTRTSGLIGTDEEMRRRLAVVQHRPTSVGGSSAASPPPLWRRDRPLDSPCTTIRSEGQFQCSTQEPHEALAGGEHGEHLVREPGAPRPPRRHAMDADEVLSHQVVDVAVVAREASGRAL